MKGAIAFVLGYLMLSVLGCQESKDLIKGNEDNLLFREVGEQIPMDKAKRWMEFYQTRINSQGRENGYALAPEKVQQSLNSDPNVIGIAFHYAIDEDGITHLLAIPVTTSLALWTKIENRVYIDANTNSVISSAVARSWAHNYESAHPLDIWFHFFGKNVLTEITSIDYFTSLNIEPAIDDVELTSELLLIVWNQTTVTNGRAQDMEEGQVYDASNACPPCQVQ